MFAYSLPFSYHVYSSPILNIFEKTHPTSAFMPHGVYTPETERRAFATLNLDFDRLLGQPENHGRPIII